MNRIFSLLTVFIVCQFFLAGSCKKDNADVPAPGPDVILPNSGFLSTMGIGHSGQTDTLTYWFSTGGDEMTTYGKGFQKSDDELSFINNGNGTVTIKRKGSYVHNNITYKMFGVQPNPSPSISDWPNNPYLYHFFYENPSDKTQFIIKRTDADINKFTIESKAYPGYFLGTAKWKNATYPTETRLVFTSKKQLFFFMQN